MSTKVKNAEAKIATESKAVVAELEAAKAGSVNVKAQATQASAQKAVLAGAELAKKKGVVEAQKELDEAAIEAERVQAEANAEQAQSASAVTEQADLAPISESAEADSDELSSEIEAVAKELDAGAETLADLVSASPLMFAQAAGSTAAAGGAAAGMSTGAIVATVAVVGVAAAASGGSSSSGAATTTSTSTAASLPASLVSSALGVSTSAFLADPSAIAGATIAAAAPVASLSTLGTSFTLTRSSLTASSLTWGDVGLSKGNIYTGTAGDDRIVFQTSVLSTAKNSVSGSDVFTGTSIVGGAGNDVLRLLVSDNVTAITDKADAAIKYNVYTSGVESIQVVNSKGSALSVDTTYLSGAQELWNWGNTGANDVSFTELGSTATVIGVYGTSTDTTAVYDSTVTGGTTISAVLHNAASGSALITNASATDNVVIDTLRVSSNGTANTTTIQDSGATVKNLTIIGDAGLTLSGVSGSALTSVNASGLKGDFTLSMSDLSGVKYSVEGGAGKNTVNANLNNSSSSDHKLSLTRVSSLNLELTHTTDQKVDATKAVGVQKIALNGTTTAGVAFTGVASGTNFETGSSLSMGAGNLSVTYAALSDMSLTLGGAVTSTGGVTVDNVQSLSVIATKTGAKSIGAITVSDEARLVSVSNSGSAGLTVGAIDASKVTTNVITKVATSASGGTIALAGDVSAAGDIFASVSASKAAVSASGAGGDFSSSSGSIALRVSTSGANATLGELAAQKGVSVNVTAAENTAASVGNVLARTGDVAMQLTGAPASTATPGSTISIANTAGQAVESSDGDIAISATIGQRGTLNLGNTTSTTSLLATNGNVELNIAADRATTVVVNNTKAGGDIVIGLSSGAPYAGSSSSASFRDLTADTGSVVLALNAGEDTTLTFNGVSANAGGVTVGSFDFKGVSVGNSGKVASALAKDSLVLINSVTAGADGLTVGSSKDGLDIGVNAAFSVGTVASAGNVNLAFDLSNESIVGAFTAIAGTGGDLGKTFVQAAGITSSAGDVVISALGKASGAVLGMGDVSGKSVSVTFEGGGKSGSESSGVMIGQVSSSGAALIDITAGAGSRVSFKHEVAGPTAVGISGSAAAGKAAVTIDLDLGAGSSVGGSPAGAAPSGGALAVGTLETTGAFTFSGPAGGASPTTGAKLSATSGDIVVVAQLASSASSATKVRFGDATATKGNVILQGGTAIGASGVLTFGNIDAQGADATLKIGDSKNIVTVGSGATLQFGTITTDAAIVIAESLSMGANATLDLGNLDSNKGIRIAPVATTSGGAINLDGILAGEGDVDLNLGVGSRTTAGVGVEISGGITATVGTSAVNIAVTTGEKSSVDLVTGSNDVTAAGDINVSIALGQGGVTSTFADGDDVTSQSGNVSFVADVGSATGLTSTLNVGNLIASSGNVSISKATAVGAAGTLTFDSLKAESVTGKVSVGGAASGDRVNVRDGATLTTGLISAGTDVVVGATLGTNANLTVGAAATATATVTAKTGSVNIAVGGAGATPSATLESDVIIGAIKADLGASVSFVGGNEATFDLDTTGTTAILSSDGTVNLSVSVGNKATAAAAISIDGHVLAEGEAGAITATLSAGDRANIVMDNADDMKATNNVVVNLTTGIGTTNTLGKITSSEGDVTLTTKLNGLSNATASTTQTGAVDASKGNVTLTGDSYVASNNTLTLGGVSALGSTGGKISIGSSTDSLVLGAGTSAGNAGKLLTGKLDAKSDVLVNVDLEEFAALTVANGTATNTAVKSSAGNVTIVSDHAKNASSVTIGSASVTQDSVFAFGTVDAKIYGGSEAKILILTDATGSGGVVSQAGSVKLDLKVSDRAAAGEAITVGGPITATFADGVKDGKVGVVDVRVESGSGSRISLAAGKLISADEKVSLNVKAGAATGGTNHVIASTGGIKANQGDVDIQVALSSTNSAAGKLDLATNGTVTSTEGNIVFRNSSVGAKGELAIGALKTEGTVSSPTTTGNIYLGGGLTPSDGLLTLGTDSRLTIGQITANRTVSISLSQESQSKASISTGENITSDRGGVFVSSVGGKSQAELFLATDGTTAKEIRSQGLVDLDFKGGLDSKVQVGNVRVLAGSIYADLEVGNSSGAANKTALTVGSLEATAQDKIIKLTATAGNGTVMSVASGASKLIRAESDILIYTKVGQGIENVATGYVNNIATDGTTDGTIESATGDVEITAIVDSTNSSDFSFATLNYGDIKANDGSVFVLGTSEVGQQGKLSFGNISAGSKDNAAPGNNGNINIGQANNYVDVRIGGRAAAGAFAARTSELEVGTLTSSQDINLYVNLETGASFKAAADSETKNSSNTAGLAADSTGAEISSSSGDVNIYIKNNQEERIEFQGQTGLQVGSEIRLGDILAREGKVTLDIQTTATDVNSAKIVDIGDIRGNRIDLTFHANRKLGETAVTMGLKRGTNMGSLTADGFDLSGQIIIDVRLTGTAPIELGTLVVNNTLNTTRVDARGLFGGLSVTGSAAQDTFYVDAGTNVLAGGSFGGDTFDLGGGSNTVTGVAVGTNVYYVRAGSNTVTGADSGANTVDRFEVSGGVSTLNAGEGNDVVTFISGGTNTVNMGDGNDTISSITGGSNTINLGTGNDTVSVSSSANTITGGTGDDRFTINGGGFARITDVGDGDDVIIVNAGSTGIAAGQVRALTHSAWTASSATASFVSADRFIIETTGAHNVDLSAANASGSNGFTVEVKHAASVTGSNGADVFNITSSSTITGGLGSDSFNVTSGTVVIEDLRTGDSVTSGTGTINATVNTVNGTFQVASTPVAGQGSLTHSSANVFTINGRAAATNVIDVSGAGGSGSYSIVGGSAADTIIGSANNDTISSGSGGNDKLYGGGGNDTITFEARDTANTAAIVIDGGAGDGDKLTLTGTALTELRSSTITGVEILDLGSAATGQKLYISQAQRGTFSTVTAHGSDVLYINPESGTADANSLLTTSAATDKFVVEANDIKLVTDTSFSASDKLNIFAIAGGETTVTALPAVDTAITAGKFYALTTANAGAGIASVTSESLLATYLETVFMGGGNAAVRDLLPVSSGTAYFFVEATSSSRLFKYTGDGDTVWETGDFAVVATIQAAAASTVLEFTAIA